MALNRSGRFFESTEDLLQTLPKVELHLHLEGSMSPALIRKLADKYQLKIDVQFAEDDSRILWTDFYDFLAKYDEASQVACCMDALEEITYDYLRNCSEQGCIYNELTVAPTLLSRFNMDYHQSISAVQRGMMRAKTDFDIDANIIIVIIRNGADADFNDIPASQLRAQQQATELVNTVIANRYPSVVGIGLAGAEKEFPPELFIEQFKSAKNSGLHLTAHAGEWTNANDVMKAIDLLGVTRIGHGIHLAFDEANLLKAKAANVHFEICPNSNLALDTKKNYPDEHKDGPHPIATFDKHDISYSLASDDPPFFATNILKEYQYVQTVLQKDLAGLLKITLNGIEASFASNELKAQLVAKVTAFAKKKQIDLPYVTRPGKGL